LFVVLFVHHFKDLLTILFAMLFTVLKGATALLLQFVDNLLMLLHQILKVLNFCFGSVQFSREEVALALENLAVLAVRHR
jgi:hypothetical protein